MSSPPPVYNFASIPTVHGRHPFWDTKYGGEAVKEIHYKDIHMPKNTGVGFYIAGASFLFGFGIIWHIMWLALLSIVAVVVLVIIRSFDENIHYVIPKALVKETEASRLQTQ